MTRTAASLLCIAAIGFVVPEAQERRTRGGVVERLDPALDDILSIDARLEAVKQDYFGTTEGPTWVRDGNGGYLAFSDMGANKIYKWDPIARRLSVLLDKAGFSGETTVSVDNDIRNVRALDNGRLLIAVLGPNGSGVDKEGRLVFCMHGDRGVARLEKDGGRIVLVDRYEGKRLNGPNDLVVKSDGSIYFTDLGSALTGKGGFAKSPDRELDFQGVFRWKPDGTLQLISRTAANGIAFSPDEQYLYVTGGGGVMRYDMRPDGSVTNYRKHVDRGADGLRVDRRGYLYGGDSRNGVWIATPDGRIIGTVRTPDAATDTVTSEAFGDPDGKGLYICTNRSLFRIRMKRSAW